MDYKSLRVKKNSQTFYSIGVGSIYAKHNSETVDENSTLKFKISVG